MTAFYEVVILFFLFGFCGWVCECVFCSIKDRKLTNRGFLTGPLCPVYGFGGLIIVYGLAPVRDNLPLLFLVGMLATTSLEYVTSYVLEKLFHTSWWDYSDLRFNLNGRVCLWFSLMFGALSVVAERLLNPPFRAMLERIPDPTKPWLALGMLAVFFTDCGITVHSILLLNGQLAELKKLSAELWVRLGASPSGEIGLIQRLEHLMLDRSEAAARLRASIRGLSERFDVLRNSSRFQHRRLLHAFPRMRSNKYAEQLAQLKESWQTLKNKAKKNEKKS